MGLVSTLGKNDWEYDKFQKCKHTCFKCEGVAFNRSVKDGKWRCKSCLGEETVNHLESLLSEKNPYINLNDFQLD